MIELPEMPRLPFEKRRETEERRDGGSAGRKGDEAMLLKKNAKNPGEP